ncbi:hypothetical protein AAULR_22504 [Lacticaseibacillus rhamnosus MTCC 5462]|nr:hypothetical protein AAULR_22504 [Lacticaseibacillus rhamnosus MTCC 5462]
MNLADRIFAMIHGKKALQKIKTCSIYYSVHTKHKLVAREKQAKMEGYTIAAARAIVAAE